MRRVTEKTSAQTGPSGSASGDRPTPEELSAALAQVSRLIARGVASFAPSNPCVQSWLLLCDELEDLRARTISLAYLTQDDPAASAENAAVRSPKD